MTEQLDGILITETAGEQTPKKRGRPSKTDKNQTQRTDGKKERITARQLGGMVFGVTVTAAELSGIEALEIEKEEADEIAGAILDVMSHYDFQASAKAVAWANLVGVLCATYGVKVLQALRKTKVADTEAVNINLVT